MQSWSDFLQFWKLFNLIKILIDLLKFCKFLKLLKMNLLLILLYLQECIIYHSCKQLISIWKFTVLDWVKINSEMNAVQSYIIRNWLKIFWEKLSQTVSFLDSFWKKLSQNILFCAIADATDDWFKNVWRKLSQMFLFSFTNTINILTYLHNLIE